MLKELDNATLESTIKSVLTATPNSPKNIRDLIETQLKADGYDTNLITSTGQDNLYIKTKARLRKWSDSGIFCIDMGGAKYVKMNSDTNAPKKVAQSKSKIIVEEIPIVQSTPEEIQEIETIITQSNMEEDLEQPKEKEQPKQAKQPKPKTQPKEKDSPIMDIIETQKNMWIEKLKAENMNYRETPLDLSCPSIRALAIATQKDCYGKYSSSDKECQVCPLAQWCTESKDTKPQNIQAYVANPTKEAKEKQEAEAKALAKAQAKALAPINSPKLNDAVSKYGKQLIDINSDIKCVISGDILKTGDKGYFVPNVGIVSTRCFS